MTAPSLDRLGGWGDLPFFRDRWPEIAAKLAREDYLPAAPDVFAAFEHTQPDDVRAVILGQDPYPTPGHANGFAFSVRPDLRPLPRSLSNIYAELEADLGVARPSGDLTDWANQGVLLLNTALTVPPGAAGGHLRLGWDALLRQVLARLDQAPRALLLWGRPAQKAARGMQHPDHLRIETPHPSPLSARTGFFGSRPFSRVNRWLEGRGAPPIAWSAA